MPAAGNLSSSNSSIDQITNLLGLLKGSKETTTTGSNISATGMNSLLQQILGSSSGLASVAGGAKSAGLYNSSTQQLLTNDLVTRTAGELAARQAGTTTTRSAPAKVGGSDILTVLGLTAGKSLLGPAISGAVKKYGVNNLGDKFAQSLGLGPAAASSDVAGYSDIPMGSGVTGALADLGTSLGSDLFVDASGSGIDPAGLFSSAADSAAADVAANAATDTAADTSGDFFASLFG